MELFIIVNLNNVQINEEVNPASFLALIYIRIEILERISHADTRAEIRL